MARSFVSGTVSSVSVRPLTRKQVYPKGHGCNLIAGNTDVSQSNGDVILPDFCSLECDGTIRLTLMASSGTSGSSLPVALPGMIQHIRNVSSHVSGVITIQNFDYSAHTTLNAGSTISLINDYRLNRWVQLHFTSGTTTTK